MPLSSQRQRFTVFVSPRNEDFLFYEKVDSQRVQQGIPEYGTPHPDYRKYPNHIFAQAVQADEDGQEYFYFYAAKRESQDDYNWEHTTVDYRQNRYDLVERTYITLRSEYDEDAPALGSAMPLSDEDPFDKSDGYVLTDRRQIRLGDAGGRFNKANELELDALFVLERRSFIKRVPITVTQYDRRTGAHIFSTTTLVHRDEVISKSTGDDPVPALFYLQPDGLSLYLQPDGISRYAVFGSGSGTSLEQSFTVADLVGDPDNEFWEVDSETGAYKQIEQVSEEWYFVTSVINGDANKRRVFLYLTPNQSDFLFYELVDRKDEQEAPANLPKYGDAHPDYPQHKFVFASPNDDTGDFYRYYYAADRFKQDEYNFAESFLDIGGVRVSLVRRSYVSLRENYDPNAPAIGAAMPKDPDNKFSGNYLLVDRVQRPIEDEILNSLYISEERIYAKAPAVADQTGNLNVNEGELTLTRTWVVPRSEVGSFTRPAVGTSDSTYGSYKYATRQISQETPPEIDSYFSVVLDIYARKGWEFREDHQYNIGYKIIEKTTLEDTKDGDGNYSVSFDGKGWQKTQRDYELTGFEYPSQVETRPYGKITTTTSAGTEPIVSANNTRSRIVFDDGTTQIYQRDKDDFQVKEGSAGQEKSEREFVSVTTNKFYRTSGDVNTDTGSSSVIYDDGVVRVYEVREEVSSAKTGDAGTTVRKTEAATITTTSTFSTNGTVSGDTGSSRVVYRGGGIIVYQVDNETAALTNTEAGQSIEKNNFATITTTSTFATSGAVTSDTGRSRIVYRGGGITIYQVDNETTVANTSGDAGKTVRKTEAVTITTNSVFSTSGAVSGDTGSSRVVYRGGGVVVYQVDNETSTLSNTQAGSSIEKNNFATITTTSTYSTSGNVTSDTGRSRVIYRGGGITVYQVDNESTVANTSGDAGKTVRKTEAVTITTNSVFSTSGSVSGDTGSSRVVYRGGGVVVYQVDNETSTLSNTEAGSSIEKNNFATITTTSTYSTSGAVRGDTGRSRVIYRGGGITVYQVDNESTVANTSGDAGTTVRKTEAVTITTNSIFSTSGTVSGDTGSSRVVYRGGGVVVYQVDNESSVVSNSDAGESIEETNFATITTTSSYTTTSNVSSTTGRSRVIYRGGGITVYQVDNESVTVKTGDAGISKEETIYASITTNSRFSTTGTVSTATGRSRVVYRGGGKIVYQVDEESVTAKTGDAGQTVEKNIYADITTNSTFSTSGTVSGDTGSSRVVYRGGGNIIYQVNNETASLTSNADAGKIEDNRPYGKLTTESTFSTTIDTGGGDGRSRPVFRGGGIIVYQNDVDSFSIKEGASAGQTRTVDLFVDVETTKEYRSSGVVLGQGSSRVVFQSGSDVVYEVSEEEPQAKTNFSWTVTSSREWGNIETKTYFNETGIPTNAQRNNRVRIVYRGDNKGTLVIVYEIQEDTPIPNTTEFVSFEETNKYYKRTVNTKYDKDIPEAAEGEEVRGTAVYNDLTETIYRVDRTKFVPEPPLIYDTEVKFTWPRVLAGLEEMNFCRDDGTSDIKYVPTWKRDYYDGPCKATIEEEWVFETPTPSQTPLFDKMMLPNDMVVDWPILSFRSGVCLHPLVKFEWYTGVNTNNGPYADNKQYATEFSPTNYTDWPSEIVTDTSVTPMETGFLKRKVTVKAPDTGAQGTTPIVLSPSSC